MKITKAQLKQIIKEEIGTVLESGFGFDTDQDEQAQVYNHYYGIKQAIATVLTDQGNDWAIDEPRWDEIITPTSGSEEDHDEFVDELKAFMQTMQLGKLEDLGVAITPYQDPVRFLPRNGMTDL